MMIFEIILTKYSLRCRYFSLNILNSIVYNSCKVLIFNGFDILTILFLIQESSLKFFPEICGLFLKVLIV